MINNTLTPNTPSAGPNGFRRRFSERDHSKLRSLLSKPISAFIEDCEFRPIHNLLEFECVSKLIHQEYEHADQPRLHKGQSWPTIFHMMNHAITIIAIYKKTNIVGTVTFVLDSSMGLPIDTMVKPYINALRAKGRHVAEATMLTHNNAILNRPDLNISEGNRIQLLLHLLEAGVEYLKSKTMVDIIVACLSRRHERFFKALLCHPITGLEYYSKSPAERSPAFYLDLSFLEKYPPDHEKDDLQCEKLYRSLEKFARRFRVATESIF